MSLLEEAYEDFTIMDKTTRPDGYGGVETVWVDGATVQAALRQNNSTAAQIAQAMTEKVTFKVLTRKNVIFRRDDVIKRNSDGKIFRITSSADEQATPDSATLDIRRCDAEEWSLTK